MCIRDMKVKISIRNVLELDCRIDGNKILLQDALKTIKPLSKIKGDVPLQKIERVLKIICTKYNYLFKLFPDCYSGEDNYIIWKSEIIDYNNLDTVCDIYGCTVYECLAKTAIKLYSIRREV